VHDVRYSTRFCEAKRHRERNGFYNLRMEQYDRSIVPINLRSGIGDSRHNDESAAERATIGFRGTIWPKTELRSVRLCPPVPFAVPGRLAAISFTSLILLLSVLLFHRRRLPILFLCARSQRCWFSRGAWKKKKNVDFTRLEWWHDVHVAFTRAALSSRYNRGVLSWHYAVIAPPSTPLNVENMMSGVFQNTSWLCSEKKRYLYIFLQPISSFTFLIFIFFAF